MGRMAELAMRLDEIDAQILRLHQHAVDPDTEELASLLDLCQIDELLERRYRLYPKEDTCSPSPRRSAGSTSSSSP